MSGRRRPRANVWRQIDQMMARHRLEERRVRKALKRRKLDGPRLDEHGRWWCDDLQLCARSGDELLRKVDDVLKLPGMDPRARAGVNLEKTGGAR